MIWPFRNRQTDDILEHALEPVWKVEAPGPWPDPPKRNSLMSLKVKLLRGFINGIPGEYTAHGWMIDYGAERARAVIMDTEEIGNELRKLRLGDTIILKLAIEIDGEETRVEYNGAAEVQMIRFRASRKELPHFRTQFKLLGLLRQPLNQPTKEQTP